MGYFLQHHRFGVPASDQPVASTLHSLHLAGRRYICLRLLPVVASDESHSTSLARNMANINLIGRFVNRPNMRKLAPSTWAVPTLP